MSENRVFELERLKYWQGQKLLSRDFRDQTSYEAQLRWWHNRALHNSYGVSYGFTVTMHNGRIQIDCGVAYDCYGRELILQAPREMALPPEPDEKFESMTLLASFKDADRSISNKEILMGTVDCSSRRVEPWFEWKLSRLVEQPHGVAIAEISYEPSAPLATLPPNVRIPVLLSDRVFYDAERKLLIAVRKNQGQASTDGLTPAEADELKKLSTDAAFGAAIDKLVAADERSPVLNAHFIAHRARALTRPRIGTGATVPGDTAWELWTETILPAVSTSTAFKLDDLNTQANIGIQVTIDTSGAGFTEVPCYFAWLEGTLWNQVHLNFFPVPLMHIDRETPRRFRLRLWMPPIITVLGARIRFANTEPGFGQRRTQLRSFATDFFNFAREQKLYVCWMGIQELVQPQCEPFPDCECDLTPPKVIEPTTPVRRPRPARNIRVNRPR